MMNDKGSPGGVKVGCSPALNPPLVTIVPCDVNDLHAVEQWTSPDSSMNSMVRVIFGF
jgi:hypothetical protein